MKRSKPARLATCPILLALAAPLAAQGGSWKDGELLVRSQIGTTQVEVLYRIEPETGNGVELISGFFWATGSGGTAFDSYRGGVLTCMGTFPDVNLYKLWFVDENGAATPVPGFDGVVLRALAPVGDGRVYLQRGLTDVIEYLDANDSIHTLMNASGTAPFSFGAEHLMYDPGTNSLLATNSGWGIEQKCAPGESSLFRIPLSVDGSHVAGPMECGSVDNVGNNIMTMDRLPGGDLLIQMAGSQFYNQTMRRVNPITFASSTFAAPQQADTNGTMWSARAGKAILLDDTANELRLFSEGQSGPGTLLSSNVDVSPPTTGFSPTETLFEIDLFGPGCAGSAYEFGSGVAGTGGVTPRLRATACPDLGLPFTIVIEDVVGGGFGGLVVGFDSLELALFGGTFYVLPFQTVPITVGGSPGSAGAGSAALPATFNTPSLVGTSLYLQAGFSDVAAIESVSLTNALELGIG